MHQEEQFKMQIKNNYFKLKNSLDVLMFWTLY